MTTRLTSGIPPQKIRYHHLLHDLQVLGQQTGSEGLADFKTVHRLLAHHYGLSEEALLLQGIRRAYRQIVEGV